MKLKSLLAAASVLFVLSSPVFADVVNINTADAETIARNLKGIGESKAKAIVAYRETHGDFATPYELANVKGIGEKTIQKNFDDIKVSGE
jgi:competence protein ComEA